MATKYFPLFYNYRTLTLNRFLGIMLGEYCQIKRSVLPVPNFLVNTFAIWSIFKIGLFLGKDRYQYFYPGGLEADFCVRHIEKKSKPNEPVPIFKVVKSVESILNKRIDQSMTIPEFRVQIDLAIQKIIELETSEKN